ncbi:MAG: HAMP domain-containing histidine kinase [Campylobacterales bacterium]|nr:HAMP domain-containing histidine kinase [Campylobacterales bacterium]
MIIQTMVAIATLAFILFAIVLGFYNIFSSLLQRDIDIFLDFFRKSAHKEQVINPHAIFFDDFKSMVGHANEMIDIINSQKKSLTELNLSLEDKVRQKTAKLQHEKDFSETILKNQKEFLRYTVHETNTPLSVILTSIEILDMKGQKSKELSKIEAATKNIFSIYDDLSYLVKKDQIEYPKKVLDIEHFLSSRIDFFSLVATMNSLEFNYTYPKDEKLFIYFNKTKLQRVVDNTLTNAIKYTLPHNPIHITLSIVGSQIELAVGSHSKEIEDTQRIFDAFYREEKSQEGFGIGLRLVKTICDEEDVSIAIDSSQEMTTFRYRFKMMGS